MFLSLRFMRFRKTVLEQLRPTHMPRERKKVVIVAALTISALLALSWIVESRALIARPWPMPLMIRIMVIPAWGTEGVKRTMRPLEMVCRPKPSQRIWVCMRRVDWRVALKMNAGTMGRRSASKLALVRRTSSALAVEMYIAMRKSWE